MKALTFNRYRLINIAVMTLMFSVAEVLIVLGARRWFPELPYTLSLNILFMSLEIMRWRSFGAVSAVAGGLVFCIASGASASQFAIYCIGNLLAMVVLLFVKAVGREKIRKDVLLSAAYVSITFIAACLGRYLVSLAFGADPVMIVQFVTTDLLSYVFALVAVLAVRNAEGIFEDQKDYLFRLDRERRERERENAGF
ncbi:MAG: hypothetical protein K6E62_04265 [Lachnospiraceae bacterium]|nr:hypothetical protein [Lachnospiraceae bacterium]